MSNSEEREIRSKRDGGYLRTIIHAETGINIGVERSRKKEVVSAKMIYSRIMRDHNHSLTSIGASIHKDHSTITHYLQNMEDYLSTDKLFLENYKVCKAEFDRVSRDESNREQVFDLSTKISDYVHQIIDIGISLKTKDNLLGSENKRLYSQVDKMEKKMEKMKEERARMAMKISDFNKDKARYGSMFNIIRERTRPGTEAEVLAKLNKFYNGLYYH